MKYIINHLETSTMDYFSGSSLPVVQVLVGGTTTYQDIKDSLLSYHNYDHLFTDYRMNDGFDAEVYEQSVEDMFSNFATLDYVPDSLYGVEDFDSEDYDEMNPCYMFFTVEVDLSEELKAVEVLRKQGYAAVYYEPEEFKDMNRDELEDRLCEEGCEQIALYRVED